MLLKSEGERKSIPSGPPPCRNWRGRPQKASSLVFQPSHPKLKSSILHTPNSFPHRLKHKCCVFDVLDWFGTVNLSSLVGWSPHCDEEIVCKKFQIQPMMLKSLTTVADLRGLFLFCISLRNCVLLLVYYCCKMLN